MIHAASEIEGLNVIQQSKLEELSNSFRYEYWELSEKMIKNYQEAIVETNDNPELVQQESDRKTALKALRNDRSELNDLARMRLRLILNDDQIEKVARLNRSVAGSLRIH